MSFCFLVVDDEQPNRDFIKSLILNFEPGAIVFEARSAVTAWSIIEENNIDILFLDIKMPETDGFGLLKKIETRDFELVFITAYSQYAIKAIKEGACDYLLKPIKIQEFKETLDKVICKRKAAKVLPANNAKAEIENLLNGTLSLNYQGGTKFIVIRTIVYLKADNTYTTLYLAGKEKITTTKPINKFLLELDPRLFFRIHKTYIVNIYHFKERVFMEKDYALMTNGEKLPISKYRLKEFLDFAHTNFIK